MRTQNSNQILNGLPDTVRNHVMKLTAQRKFSEAKEVIQKYEALKKKVDKGKRMEQRLLTQLRVAFFRGYDFPGVPHELQPYTNRLMDEAMRRLIERNANIEAFQQMAANADLQALERNTEVFPKVESLRDVEPLPTQEFVINSIGNPVERDEFRLMVQKTYFLNERKKEKIRHVSGITPRTSKKGRPYISGFVYWEKPVWLMSPAEMWEHDLKRKMKSTRIAMDLALAKGDFDMFNLHMERLERFDSYMKKGYRFFNTTDHYKEVSVEWEPVQMMQEDKVPVFKAKVSRITEYTGHRSIMLHQMKELHQAEMEKHRKKLHAEWERLRQLNMGTAVNHGWGCLMHDDYEPRGPENKRGGKKRGMKCGKPKKSTKSNRGVKRVDITKQVKKGQKRMEREIQRENKAKAFDNLFL